MPPKTPIQQKSGGPINMPISVPANVKNSISGKLQEDIKKRLNVTSLDDGMKKVIEEIAEDVVANMTRQNITKTAISVTKDMLRGKIDRSRAVRERLLGALEGVRLVSQADELNEILRENARMLFNKKQALVDAGFSEEQAFQLIMAEVSAKKSK
jgi:hypothetical protein